MPSTMKIESEFVEQLSSVHPRDLIEILQSEDRPHFDNHWKIFNEIKPGDLYCYLYGRFGPQTAYKISCVAITLKILSIGSGLLPLKAESS